MPGKQNPTSSIASAISYIISTRQARSHAHPHPSMACSNHVALYCALLTLLFKYPAHFSSHAQLLPVITDRGRGDGQTQTYIVHVATPGDSALLSDEDLEGWHRSFLPNATLASGAPRLVYSYRHAISGFAARLDPEEVGAMASKDGFLHARPDRRYGPATTYTPEFLGLSQPIHGVWDEGVYGAGIIIGVVDFGIYPTHPSFDGSGMPPLPPQHHWKGGCNYTGFPCNNKIIGAKAFYGGTHPTPMDFGGHGTQAASTAAGNFVADAHVLGMARGVAAGMAPKAHLSIYKVCFDDEGDSSDILAGIDQAISDGVDVLSMSVSPLVEERPLYDDDVAVGSLAAFKKRISPCTIAGNYGPEMRTLRHSAPWLLTVGASSTDRRVSASVTLGDGREFQGEAGYQPKSFNSSKLLPVIYPGAIVDVPDASHCVNGTLDQIDVRGKVVFCFRGGDDDSVKATRVYAAGGAAVILANQPGDGYTTFSDAHVLPAVHVSLEDGLKILKYIRTSAAPAASFKFNGTTFGFRPSPAVASFSSRGPSDENGHIIKPDVLAPGVNILVATPSGVGPDPPPFETKTFKFESGTSFAAPHVSGVIALLKSKHKDWSPAAIQSAIITSARELDLSGSPIMDEDMNTTAEVYDTGAGQLNPAGAMDPGLIYDLTHDDYVSYLCGLPGYNDTQVQWTVGEPVDCSKRKVTGPSQLNYPSIAVNVHPRSKALTVERTVTNVGKPNEDYLAVIKEPPGVSVYLSTYDLRFYRVHQEKSYNVTFMVKKYPGQGVILRGKLEWVSDAHVVSSPIAVRFN